MIDAVIILAYSPPKQLHVICMFVHPYTAWSDTARQLSPVCRQISTSTVLGESWTGRVVQVWCGYLSRTGVNPPCSSSSLSRDPLQTPENCVDCNQTWHVCLLDLQYVNQLWTVFRPLASSGPWLFFHFSSILYSEVWYTFESRNDRHMNLCRNI